jgi:hypothetical protein
MRRTVRRLVRRALCRARFDLATLMGEVGMRRFLSSACVAVAMAAMAACGGGDEADVDAGAELAPPPVDTTPPVMMDTTMVDTMMADTMMLDTMTDTTSTGGL